MPIHGYPGNVITANPTAPTSSVASGVWTTEQQLIAKAAGNWPTTIPTQQISQSLRFNSADSAYLSRTPASAGNRKTWTWNGWVKRSGSGVRLFCSGDQAVSLLRSFLLFGDNISFIDVDASNTTLAYVDSVAVFRDYSAWYCVTFVVDTTQATGSNRIKLYVNGVQQTLTFSTTPSQNADLAMNAASRMTLGTAYDTSSFLDCYLAEVNFVDGQALTPSSFGQTNASTGVWEPIPYTGTYGTNGFELSFSDNSTLVDVASDSATGSFSKRLTSGTNIGGMTSNGGLAAAFNGAFNNEASSAVSSTTTSGYVTTNSVGKDWGSGVTKTITAFQINSPTNDGFIGNQVAVGFKLQGSTDNFSSSVVDLYSGTTPAGFNQSVLVTSGITTSTAYRYHRIVINGNGTNNTRFGQVMLYETGSFGVNQWQTNNFSVTAGAGNDSMVDSPTAYGTDTGVGGEVRGNYCTWNPNRSFTSNTTLSNGNLNALLTGASNAHNAYGTLGVSSGKWYWEITVDATASTYYPGIGVDTNLGLTNSTVQSGDLATGFIYLVNGQKYNNSTLTNYGASYTANDVIGVALDMDAGTLTFYKNNSSQGQAFSGITGTAVPVVTGYNNAQATANFGQRAFAYTAPSGFKALCTQNLPTPTIGATSTTQANDYFNIILWSGNNSYPRALTGVGFAPDLVWVKSRTNAYSHVLYDSVRGTGTSKSLYSNEASAEGTNSANANLTSFDADGFTVGSTSGTNILNTNSGVTYVGWNWNAGGLTVTNTSGTISAQVRANTTSGFSIATFTQLSGSPYIGTVGHGLGVAPSMVIIKDRSMANGWLVYHSALGATKYLVLSSTAAAATGSNAFNDTAPTSTVFTTAAGSTYWGNAGATAVAYCFAPVAGYSAFGSYTGNGSTDGAFIYTGFRPAYVLIKSSSNAGTEWEIRDDMRLTYNPETELLWANSSSATYATDPYYKSDFLSNGFKLRNTNSASNASGYTYVYAAFAEFPFKFSLAR